MEQVGAVVVGAGAASSWDTPTENSLWRPVWLDGRKLAHQL